MTAAADRLTPMGVLIYRLSFGCLHLLQYEHKALKDLLEKGHPNAEKKVGLT